MFSGLVRLLTKTIIQISDENPEAEYVPSETDTDELSNKAIGDIDDSSEENGRNIEIPSDEFLGKIPEEPRTGTVIQIKTNTNTKSKRIYDKNYFFILRAILQSNY